MYFRRNSTGNVLWTSLTCSTIIHFLILELGITSEHAAAQSSRAEWFHKKLEVTISQRCTEVPLKSEITELCKGCFLSSSAGVSFGYLYSLLHTLENFNYFINPAFSTWFLQQTKHNLENCFGFVNTHYNCIRKI